jgi:excisionase family DNA binding protein
MIEQHFTIMELSELLAIPENTLRKYCRTGKLKAVKVGRKFLVTEESVNELLER